MDAASPDLTFAPVTRGQSRLFAAIGRMLDRRGVVCRFAAPSTEVADDVLDEWGDLVEIAGESSCGETAHGSVPGHVGAYDAWRSGWSEDQRIAAAGAALSFWRCYFGAHRPKAVVLWNGRDDVFVEAAVCAAREIDVGIICMELGPLRQSPMTVAISRNGINATAEFRRPDKLSEPLAPWEAAHLQAVRARFRAGITAHRDAGPFVFLPLQVDDDTQLYYYAPHFVDQRAMVKAVADAMPDGVALVIKPHPLCDPRFGCSQYAPLLRAGDRIAPPGANTLGLIAAAAAVITNNSSAGIEALMLGRPVVVLGEAHYRGRGFTYDYMGNDALHRLICAASGDVPTDAAVRIRDRYLYELLFHELVHIEHHPMHEALSEEEYERLAVRLWDLVQPDRLGSDWQSVFNEIHAIRGLLEDAIQGSLQGVVPAGMLVTSRFAALCLADLPGVEPAVLEDLLPGSAELVAGRDVHLLAPDLSPGQCAAVSARLCEAGARNVRNVMHRLSRQPCMFHVGRFNRLPRAMRDELYRNSAYWDYYLAQSGLSSENTPAKDIQAETVSKQLWHGSPKTVLEYGCGDGRILQRLTADGDHSWIGIVGVDSSERMLQLARARLCSVAGVTLLPADASKALPFADASFDTTFTCGALQHVHADDLPAVVKQLHRVTTHTTIHWETFEAFRPSPGEHYTNPDASRAVHRSTFARFGPVRMQIEDARPLNGDDSLLTRYELDQPLITVLTMHAIGTPDPACESLDYRNMFLSPEQLGEILDGLARGGYRFITLSEAMATARGEAPPLHKAVVITFDDGYASVFDVSRPLLEERGIRAAAFIPTGYIAQSFGGNPREGGGPALPSMTPDQIRALRDAGWDIGSHSVSHSAFAALTADQAKRELVESKVRLEAMLGQTVSTFAFPYGEPDVAYRREQVEMATEAGYELILTMRPGFVPIGHDASDWPRVGVGANTTADSLLEDLAALHREMSGWPREQAQSGSSLRQRVRGAVRCCIDKGVERIALYGAGRHTARLVQTASLWPLHVLGIIDDDVSLHGARRHGLPVYGPADLSNLDPEAVLISSDQYEEAIYQRVAPLEARGIRVLRLYDGES